MEVAFLIVPLAVMGVGALIVVLSVKALFDAGKQHSWKQTTGVVRDSPIHTKQVGRWTVTTSGWTGSSPRVTYEYQVDGRSYTATGHAYVREQRGLFGRRPRLSDFSQGATVPVYYDPADPARSVISRTTFGCGPIVGIVFGTIIVAFGWGFFKLASMVPG